MTKAQRNFGILALVLMLLAINELSAQFEGSRIHVTEGFEVDQIYAVPADTQGSWVALCVDDKGRLIAGDQEGGLYRITLLGGEVDSVKALDVEVGFVNGLTYAFNSLYAVVAEDEFQGGGLYRIRDLDGDDEFDEVQYLRDFVARGEHGPHSVVPGPEGKWLYVISGNKTPIPEGEGFESIVPPRWGEDDLLPRLWGPIGSEKGTTAPGGWIARTDPEGKTWQLLAIGFRNAFDIAFNQSGDLFTVDADAEFDMGTPWYQPTRLLHVVYGTDFGWRSGSGKWPPHFADTIPPVFEYGPGSPTAVTFGYGTHFPEKYQNALFACDWSWGRVFVTWLTPNGASYAGETEEFMSGVPLPIADLIVNPFDGAMYFVLGGRDTTSGLYRIEYTGSSAKQSLTSVPIKRRIADSDSVWQKLHSADQVIRHEARISLEKTPLSHWSERALKEKNPVARMTALLALARAGSKEDLSGILDSLFELNWQAFNRGEELLALRCLEVAFIRMGPPDADLQSKVRQMLEGLFPAEDTLLNAELLKLLIYLESAAATLPGIELLENAVTQEDELRFLLPLRVQTNGWTHELRQRFMVKLGSAHGWSGGRSLMEYVKMITEDTLLTIPDEDREYYQKMIQDSQPIPEKSRVVVGSFVKERTLDDFNGINADALTGRDELNGRRVFEAASCFACHRVNGEGGGLGPDLTAVLRRFSINEFLESVIEPSKVISDQYGISVIEKTDGTQLHGRVVNYYQDKIGFQTDLLNSAEVLRIPKSEIVSLELSPVSSMPAGLLDTLSRNDILDMIAWLHDLGSVSN